MVQTITDEQAKAYYVDPFDATKRWNDKDCSPQPLGRIVVNRNPENYHRDVEQAAFSPGRLVPGIEPSPNALLQWRLVFYNDAQIYRLGVNYHKVLARGAVSSGKGLGTLTTARTTEAQERVKYCTIASQRQFELLPFVMETTGGMGTSAVLLIKAMADASEKHLAIWTKEQVIRELVGSVAVAVQRGGLLTYRNGYDKVLQMMGAAEVGGAEEAAGEEAVRVTNVIRRRVPRQWHARRKS